MSDDATCPTADELGRYLLGWRPDDPADAARLDEHVAACPRCDARAEALAGDELVNELRTGVGPLVPPGPSMRRLIDECKRLDRAASTAPRGEAVAAPEEIGPYRIRRVLGRGGMGVVYEGRHRSLGRLAAVKTIAATLASAESLARFEAEAEAVARLRHPNVVRLYEIGTHEGRPFVALELAEGGDLAEALAGEPRPPRDAAALVAALADAVEAAHRAGVVHRDLKPSNVLLASDGPGAEATTPKVADFGLAKLLDAHSGQTSTGRVLGTPSYTSPEQARGDKDVGPLADVYALGAILYEMLTGRPPFRGTTPLETLAQVVRDEPPAPRALVPTVPRDLEVIAMKCLEKEPSRRYGSAGELRDDMRRFLAGVPVRARPASLARRAAMWARRRPAVATLVLTSLLAISALLGTWLKFTADLREQRNVARGKEREANEQREEAIRSLREARGAANEFFRLVHSDKEFANQGNHGLRYRLLERTLLLQEKLNERYADDEELLGEMAHSYFDLGQLAAYVGQTDDAFRHNSRAIELGEMLLARHPDDVNLVRNQASRLSERGIYLSQQGRLDEADASYRRAIDLLGDVTRGSTNNQLWWHRASVRDNRARLLSRRGNRDEAEKLALAARDDMLEAIRLHAVHLPNNPDPGDYSERLARIQLQLSGIYGDTGRWPEAEAEREAAGERIRNALNNLPKHPNYLHTRALFLELRASQSRAQGKRDEAKARYLAALEFREKVVREHPRVVRLRVSLATLRGEWAGFNADAPEVAAEAYRAALASWAGLCKDSPKVWSYPRSFARHALALDKLPAGSRADDAHLTQAIDFVAPWLKEGGPDDVRPLLVQLHRARGERRRAAGRADAEQDFRQARMLEEEK